jgi:hypothetical protein
MANRKADYVQRQKQDRPHSCHWPGCKQQVPPAKWGCAAHWFQLPKELRDLIWSTYRPGQEKDMRPSRAYLDAANKVQKWIKAFQKTRLHHDNCAKVRYRVVKKGT